MNETSPRLTKRTEATETQSESSERTNEPIRDWEGESDSLDKTDIDYMIACVVISVLGLIAIGMVIGFLIWYFWRSH